MYPNFQWQDKAEQTHQTFSAFTNYRYKSRTASFFVFLFFYLCRSDKNVQDLKYWQHRACLIWANFYKFCLLLQLVWQLQFLIFFILLGKLMKSNIHCSGESFTKFFQTFYLKGSWTLQWPVQKKRSIFVTVWERKKSLLDAQPTIKDDKSKQSSASNIHKKQSITFTQTVNNIHTNSQQY